MNIQVISSKACAHHNFYCIGTQSAKVMKNIYFFICAILGTLLLCVLYVNDINKVSRVHGFHKINLPPEDTHTPPPKADEKKITQKIPILKRLNNQRKRLAHQTYTTNHIL